VAERHRGVVTETELARIERDEDVGSAELGLRLDEAKRLTAALQAVMVPAQMAALSECPHACEALLHGSGGGVRSWAGVGDLPLI
jgi:hypothetical protein